MEFSIQRIINEMQNFQKEMHNEFKDAKTFWKHFYKKLDKEIYKEFKNIVEEKEVEEINKKKKEGALEYAEPISQKILVVEINVENGENKKQIKDLMEEVFKTFDESEIEVIEINK